MADYKIDTLFEVLEKNFKDDNKEAIVHSCTRILGYSHFLDEKTQSILFIAKGIALVKLHHYTLAILNVKQAISVCPESNELGQRALEFVKQKIME